MLYLMFIKIISGIMAMKKYDTTYIKTLTNKEIQYNGCISMLCLKVQGDASIVVLVSKGYHT